MKTVKRGMVLLMGMVVVMSFAACGSKKVDKNNTDKKTQQESADKETEYFGKVKGMVGNEIEVEIAKNKEFDAAQQEAKEKNKDESEAPTVASSTTEASEGVKPASEPETGKTKKMELDYTGESKSFTLPAGLQIMGLGGVKADMKDIKEGSVLFITTSGSPEAPVIISIQILE